MTPAWQWAVHGLEIHDGDGEVLWGHGWAVNLLAAVIMGCAMVSEKGDRVASGSVMMVIVAMLDGEDGRGNEDARFGF
ncbi:hypothetical protein M0R45_008193 [Rubus argutus]|uniref:Uncharacterized protein n=1 Tax=Rubus argutus TaxID=59490 RepID=A0AAW1Y0X0_RUBAR